MTKDQFIKLFRGQARQVWCTYFIRAGWPEDAAERMADFLVGYVKEVPKWEDMVPPAGIEPAPPEETAF